MQSICNSIRKEGQSDIDTTSHSDEDVFTHKCVYTSSETQNKNDLQRNIWQSDTDFITLLDNPTLTF
jgi:hypothetical protein